MEDGNSRDTYPGHTLVRNLGVGQYGVTKLFSNDATGELVAVKFLKRGSNISETVQYVERELLYHMQLTGHPNIVGFREVFLTRYSLGIAMDYAAGGEMFDYIVEAHRLPEPCARYFFQQLVSALAWCHKNGVSHRDIKLENLLLDRSVPKATLRSAEALLEARPLLKICDFGFSKSRVLDSQPKSTVGTPAYLAPEVLTSKEYSGELADVWSSGVALFVMLCGYYPFEDESDPGNIKKMLNRISEADYEIPRSLALSGECRDLLRRIFVPDPSQRISLAEVQRHPFFLKDLPPELQGPGAAHQAPTFQQSADEILQLVEQACSLGRTPSSRRERRPDFIEQGLSCSDSQSEEGEEKHVDAYIDLMMGEKGAAEQPGTPPKDGGAATGVGSSGDAVGSSSGNISAGAGGSGEQRPEPPGNLVLHSPFEIAPPPSEASGAGAADTSAAAAGAAAEGGMVESDSRLDSMLSTGLDPFIVPSDEVTLGEQLGGSSRSSGGATHLGTWRGQDVEVRLLADLMPVLEGGDEAEAFLSHPALHDLRQEMRIRAQLQDPNLVRFYGVLLSPLGTVSEYCSHHTLGDVIKSARALPSQAAQLDMTRRMSMALGIANGILYLHSLQPTPIVHCDLRASTVMIDEGWNAKVSGFSVSRAMDEGAEDSGFQPHSNPRWCAPEVLDGGQPTEASDTYAFGVLLWQLLTLETPWGSQRRVWEICKAVIRGEQLEVPPPERLPPSSQGFAGLAQLGALIRQCCAKDPAARPSFKEIVPRVRELLAIARGEQGGEQQAEAPKESAPAEPQPPRTAAEQPPGTAAGAAAAAASQLAVESAPAAAAVPSEQRQQQGEPELPVSRSARTLDVQQPQVQPAAVPQQAQAAKQVQQQSTKLEAAEAGPLPPRSWLARLCCGG